MVSFDSVVACDEEPAAKTPAKKRRQAFPRELRSPVTTTPVSLPPAPTSLESITPPQFTSVLRPDGVQITCGDLVTVSATCTDLALLVTEIFEQDSREMVKAQKCELNENISMKLTEDFNVTCPVSSVHKLDNKTSASFAKTILEVRRRAMARTAESLCHYAGNRTYQL